MQKICIILFILLTCIFPIINIAVLEFDAKNVTTTEASIIADAIRSEFVKFNEYRVLDRTHMNMILAEQELQMSGCTDTECAVEIGKILNMKYMVLGSLSKFGETYILTVNMIDVETSVIKSSENIKTQVLDELLDHIQPIIISLTQSKPIEINTAGLTSTSDSSSSKTISGSKFIFNISTKTFCDIKTYYTPLKIQELYIGLLDRKWTDYINRKNYYQFDTGLLLVADKRDRLLKIKGHNPKMKTDKDLIIGDTIDKMKNLYGNPAKEKIINSTITEYTYNYGKFLVKYNTEKASTGENKISWIEIELIR